MKKAGRSFATVLLLFVLTTTALAGQMDTTMPTPHTSNSQMDTTAPSPGQIDVAPAATVG